MVPPPDPGPLPAQNAWSTSLSFITQSTRGALISEGSHPHMRRSQPSCSGAGQPPTPHLAPYCFPHLPCDALSGVASVREKEDGCTESRLRRSSSILWLRADDKKCVCVCLVRRGKRRCQTRTMVRCRCRRQSPEGERRSLESMVSVKLPLWEGLGRRRDEVCAGCGGKGTVVWDGWPWQMLNGTP